MGKYPVHTKNSPNQLIPPNSYKPSMPQPLRKRNPPPGYNQLLCLGLNYCDETLHSNPNLKQMIDKLKKSIHLKHWVDKYGANNNNKGCIPSVFIPTTWKPPEASTETEEAIKNFTSNIKYSGRKQNLPKVQPHQASI